ncbi:MAG TPA: hypothetical protein VN873_14500 [Candidatus Angelobacter sp.]|nr:hypothetical protein [Candidatus Angelobacter sp.]
MHSNSTKLIKTRAFSALGLIATATLIVLGAIWPSFFSILAILVVPAPFIFGLLLFRPKLFDSHMVMRAYSIGSVAVSMVALTTQLTWIILK